MTFFTSDMASLITSFIRYGKPTHIKMAEHFLFLMNMNFFLRMVELLFFMLCEGTTSNV